MAEANPRIRKISTPMLRITVTSVFVDDQAKALAFYTDKLGFRPRTDVPAGGARWLTVGDDHSDVELLLEPNQHPAAQAYQQALTIGCKGQASY